MHDLDVEPRLKGVAISMTRIDGHAVWTNGKGVEMARKYFPENWEMEGGEIVVDADGKPTGVFIDDAMNFVQSAIPPPTENAMILCLLTCNDLPPRLLPYDEGHHLRVGSVKLLMDGALGSWGAAMIEPYSDAPDKTGLLRIPKDRIQDLIWEVMDQDYQVNVHCIGDLANKLVLDAFEANHRRWDSNHTTPARHLRNRIEHSQIMRLQDVPRFGSLGVIPSVQPTHGSRAEGAYVWRTFLEGRGVPHLPLGSDFPIEDVDPMKGIYSAVTRKYPDGSSPHNDTDGWYPKEKLTREQALRGFTLSAAYASFQEDILGSITAGKLADFVVYEKNWLSPLEVAEDEILKMKPKAVVVGGVVRFGKL
ncbi:amidohydrolase family-domain-containing protein [Chytridium lagenaria]|nr:amidohydrolase family-domain-containing protein [Chytridium lagenaria]